MSRSWKIAIVIGATIVALNLMLVAIRSLTGGTPGGPRSSSYATGGDGLAAYADLLADAGHRVERVRKAPHESEPSPEATAVLLDPGLVGAKDATALRRFVSAGGRLLAGGNNAAWVRRIVGSGPNWSRRPIAGGRVVSPVPELAGVVRVTELREGSWRETGGALPAYAGRDATLLAVSSLGAGRVLLLADAAPIQNAALGTADNAAFGLGLAGAPRRPVVFLETFHGYGRRSGLAAIPGNWWLLFGTAAAAVAAYMLARGRRLGPPEQTARELPPPRLEYVESLGGVLARTRGRAEAAEPLQAEARRLLARRLGLSADADALVAAATRFGLSADEASALVRRADTDADLVSAGRAFAGVARLQRGGRWKS